MFAVRTIDESWCKIGKVTLTKEIETVKRGGDFHRKSTGHMTRGTTSKKCGNKYAPAGQPY